MLNTLGHCYDSFGISSELYELIKLNNYELKTGRGGWGLGIGPVVLTAKEFRCASLIPILPQMETWPYVKMRDFDGVAEVVHSLALTKAREIRDKPPEFDFDNLFYDSEKLFPASDTAALINPIQSRKVILFNRVNSDHQVVDKKIHDWFIQNRVPKEYRTQFELSWVKEIYCPDLPPKFHKLNDGQKVRYPQLGNNIFNYYVAPANASHQRLDNPKLHPILEKFFNHLFENKESRDYVYRWLYTLTHDFYRKTPSLILCGKAGTGKNTLVENIMVGLVGSTNFHKAAQLSERFNSSVLNCVLHFSDEGVLDGVTKRNFKGFHEMDVAIEKKGVDVGDPERIYARFVFATNNRTDVRLDHNDRKFSVPELSDIKLIDAFTLDEQQFLFTFKDNITSQVEFLSWLEVYHKHNKPETPYHNTLFREICFESLPDWFQSTIYMLKSNESFFLRKFVKNLTGRKPGPDKFKQRLISYEHQIGKKIADLEMQASGDILVKSLIFEGEKG